MTTHRSITVVMVVAAVGACHAAPEASHGTWQLVWSDEFDGSDESRVDPTKWSAVTGGDGWGNQEREYYTDDTANVHQGGGNLVITAMNNPPGRTCWYGACKYTSARLETKGHVAQAYGRFEARIKIPYGQGLWPAFWMLGNDIDITGWPACGEIDIMENVGRERGVVHATLHGPGYSGANGLTASYELPDGSRFADDFHVFAVEWEMESARFYVDGEPYQTRTRSEIPAGSRWVFDHPFFLLLNVAVGGVWPGDPDSTTAFPQTMLVDYVRIYR